MPEVQRIWKVGGYRALNPKLLAEAAVQQGWPLAWLGKANGVNCPRGRQYGEAHFLLAQESLAALDLSAAIDITCEHENGTTTFPGYYVIRTQAVTRDALKPPVWITLADRRWLLEKSACSRRFNCVRDTWQYITSTLNAGSAYSWQEVLDTLWGLLPAAAGTVPTLPVSPASVPQNLVFDGGSAWRAINQVLTAIGCAAVLNPTTGVFTCVNTADDGSRDSEVADYAKRLLWQFAPDELPATNYPASVAVTYRALPTVATTPTLFGAEPVVSTASLGAGGIAGTAISITDTVMSNGINGADLTTRTAEIATAVKGLLKPAAEPWGNVYSGIVPLLCSSDVTDVTWISDGHRGMLTIAKNVTQGTIDWPHMAEQTEQLGDIHYDYELITSWFGGIALASKRSMDQADLGETVIVRDPRGIFSFQKPGDGGIMVYQPPADHYYAIQANCRSTPNLPVDPVGACCYYSAQDGYSCFDATSADCVAFGGTWKGEGTSCETATCP